MPQTIQFEGQTHQFPDDFTPADIQRALSSVPAAPAAPPVEQGGGLSLIETTPATATAPARVVMDTSGRANRPAALLPTSVGGAVRDFTVGAQGVGKGIADIVTGPFDLVAGAQNLATSGINKVFGTNIPLATPASKLLEQGVDATGIGDALIDPATMSNSEKLAYDVNRFGTQAVGMGSMLMQRAPQVAAQTTPRGITEGGIGDALARPYAASPGQALVGDAVGGAGAGVAVNAADNIVPDEAAIGGTVPKQVANFVAPIVGGLGANTLQGIAQGIGGALRNLARNTFKTETQVPVNPNGKAYSSTTVDRAAQQMQDGQKSPALSARTIRENADELTNPTKPGETPVEASQLPTSGLLSQDPALVTAEEGARVRNRAPFIQRDQKVKEAAADRVASLQDPEADLGSVMRRAGEARQERLAPAEQQVNQFEGLNNLATQRRQQEGAAYAPIANSEAKANASRRLDRNIVDENYIPARTEKNRQFDEAPGRAAELPADDVFAAIDRVRRNANDLAPGTLPNDFMRRLDALRPRIDPETGQNVGGPGTAGGGDLADLRKFVGDAQQRAQQSGNFDLADNLASLKAAINRTIETAPGYAEANANYGQFADRFRPERNDPAAKFTKEIDRGGQAPDGTLNRGSTPPSETASRFLSGPEEAAALQRMMDGAPNAAQGTAAVRDYFRADFASSALNADGTLNPAKASAWARAKADVLATFPAIRTEFDNIVAAARRGEQLSADAKRGLDAAKANSKRTEAEIDRGAIGTLLREDPRDVAKGLLNGGYGSEAKLGEIQKTIGTDKEAARGWKAAVAEVLTSRVTSARKIGESNEVQLARLNKEFKDNEALLAKTFTPEEMNTLRQGHKLLSYFEEAAKRSTAGSQTAERVNIPGPMQLAVRHIYGDLKGGGIIKRFKLMLELLPSSKQGAQEIVDAAWFDPNLAAFLLERKIPNPNASFNNVPLRRLIGAANAARESGPDDE